MATSTLENKAAIEAEYGSKANAIRAITQGQIDTGLAGLAGLVIQATEALAVFLAREALNYRPLVGGEGDALKAAVSDLSAANAQVRSAIAHVQTALPV